MTVIFHSVSPLLRGLWKLPDGRDRLRGKLGVVLMGGAMLSKSLIQFSVDGRGCVPSLFFDLRPNYGRDNDDLQKDLCLNPCIQYSGHASMGDSWTLTGKSGSVSCGVTAPFSWVLVHTRFCLHPFVCQESVSQSCGISVIKSH